MSVKLYSTSICTSREIRTRIERIKNVLGSMGIEYEEIDIAENNDLKETMRELSNNPVAIPPQLFKEDEYLGNYDNFEEAVENKCLKTFLRLE